MTVFIGAAQSKDEHENDAVYLKPMVYNLVNALNSADSIQNDLRSFKSYLEEQLADTENEDGLSSAVNGVQYTYDTDLLVYTENVDGSIIRSDSQE